MEKVQFSWTKDKIQKYKTYWEIRQFHFADFGRQNIITKWKAQLIERRNKKKDTGTRVFFLPIIWLLLSSFSTFLIKTQRLFPRVHSRNEKKLFFSEEEVKKWGVKKSNSYYKNNLFLTRNASIFRFEIKVFSTFFLDLVQN